MSRGPHLWTFAKHLFFYADLKGKDAQILAKGIATLFAVSTGR